MIATERTVADRRAEIDGLLTGPPATAAPAGPQPADPGGVAPPPWWRGDDDAYTSSQRAAAQAR